MSIDVQPTAANSTAGRRRPLFSSAVGCAGVILAVAGLVACGSGESSSTAAATTTTVVAPTTTTTARPTTTVPVTTSVAVAPVVGTREELVVRLIGHAVSTLPVTELRNVANQVQAELDSAALGMGFRSAVVARSERETRTLAFTVTDAVPADWDGACTDTVIRHLVLVSDTAVSAPGITAVPSTAAPELSSLSVVVTSLLADVSASLFSEGVRR